MKNQKQTLRKIVSFLNNPDEEGGFWLPNIQRPFVWSEEQICRLFDSILREYPISTLLIWKTNSSIRRRKFIDNWKSGLRLSDFYVPEDSRKKCLVLDGQQRLQSLFIGLSGSYDGRELYFDILSGEVAAPDDVKFRFSFRDAQKADFPWVLFKELVSTTRSNRQISRSIADGAGRTLSDPELEKIDEHLNLVSRTFKMNEAVSYQELDSIDNPELYTEDDVVEVFIRANSGGTKLGKSDLLFSLLSASWEVADEQMEGLLEKLNRQGFAFTRDFVLKTCLSVLGQGARYKVAKFRKQGVREKIQADWDRIAEAICDVLDFVREKTFIRCDKALPSHLGLIPLIHARFHRPDTWGGLDGRESYLVRTLLAGSFSGSPDNLLDALNELIDEPGGFDVDPIFNLVRRQGRSMELVEGKFWEMGYGSNMVHLLFNLWYPNVSYVPAYENNMPQVDHVFPQSALKQVKVVNPRTGRKVQKFRAPQRNQLANCMLLTRQENGAGGKGSILPEDWFHGKSEEYLDLHLIPRDASLWKLDRYEDFIEARKSLLREKFSYLLAPISTQRMQGPS